MPADAFIISAIKRGETAVALRLATEGRFTSNVLSFAAEVCQFDLLYDLYQLAEPRGEDLSFFFLGDVVREKRIDVLEYLLTRGFDLDTPFGDETILMRACASGQRDIVEWLIAHQVSLEIVDWYDWTALFHSVFSSDVNIFRLLITHGARIDHLDMSGRNVLHHLCLKASGSEEIFHEILGMKVFDINDRDEYGETVLHLAVRGFITYQGCQFFHHQRAFSEFVIPFLVQHPDIDLTIKSEEGETALRLCLDNNVPYANLIGAALEKDIATRELNLTILAPA